MASEACCTPAPPAEHHEEGQSVKFAGLDAYVNPGPAGATAALVLVSDIMGFDPPLLRKLADRCAAEGFYVVVPDLFRGDPFQPQDMKNRASLIPAWVAKHPPTDLTDVKAVINQLKEQGFQSIGVTGCCWGGKVAILLASEDPSLINAAVLFHPSFVNHDDVHAFKVPVQFSIPETDQQVTAEKAEEFKTILSSRPEVASSFKIFPGMVHGWAIRYDVNSPEQVKSAHEAHDDMISWFKQHLKV
ncbi:carboxymethylenebutenolidase [Marchantia polymorpha subsp. ruderalis]|uniref:Dienelactone hydrolase domain-containing protein n=2 Tax=Marchantia polymorpha TaxID=3197 RepID=A0AAF6BUF1_MARPO|nr:hypothetical protein MARPO_0091s0038 [Marchantia polymorpha]BBN15635.1 hypothetical protein Mp_6g21170 [Marchantia polymorpha subsp. ruderalis]|eukprot:PTQ33179.1 hypothetical protein MARPO_0091s0038 [Marchantia polymorpha]